MSHHDEEMTPAEVREGCKQIDKFLGAVEGKLLSKLSPDGQSVLLGLRRIMIEAQNLTDEEIACIAVVATEARDG